METIHYRAADVGGLKISYRGSRPNGRSNVAVVARVSKCRAHVPRFDSTSRQHAFTSVAPDLPGFAVKVGPALHAKSSDTTFEKLAETIDHFTEIIGLKRFAIYIFDYGAPVGLRIALKHPERISAIVSQNGNAYEEGLSEAWNPIRTYWREPTQANRDALRSFLSPETTLFQYTQGVADSSLVSPDGRSLDEYYLARPGAHEAQLDLLLDYASNVALYPQFQAYFRKHKPPLLGSLGQERPVFYTCRSRRHSGGIIRKQEVHFYPTGHFALETHCRRNCGCYSGDFLSRGFLAYL